MRGVGVDAARVRAAAQQHRDQPCAVGIDGGQQRRLTLGVARVGERGLGVEQPAHGGLVTACDRAEELAHPVGRRGPRRAVEPGPEGAPAREALLPRDRELGVGQARARVRAAQRLEPVLGELLQILEAGTIGERHETPSFRVPGVRGIGRKVVAASCTNRWVRPFTRTVSRLDGWP